MDDYIVTSSETDGVSVEAVIRLDAYPDWMAVEDLHKADLRDWLEHTAQSARGLIGDKLKSIYWGVDDTTTSAVPDFDGTERNQEPDGTTWVHRLVAAWWAKPGTQLEIYNRKTGTEQPAPPNYRFDKVPDAKLSSVLSQLRNQYQRVDLAGDRVTVRDYQPIIFPRTSATPLGVVGMLSVEEGARWQALKERDAATLGTWAKQAWALTKNLPYQDRTLVFAVVDVVAKPPAGYDESELTYLPDRRILVIRTLAFVDSSGDLYSWAPAQRDRPVRSSPFDNYTPVIRLDPATTYLVPDRSRSR